MVLAPHPDDETLGFGGIIAAAVADGTDVTVVVLTGGGASHRHVDWPMERLVAVREAETVAAVAALGLAAHRLHFLRRVDGALVDDEATVAEVAAVLARSGARTLLVTDAADGHPDHRAAFRLAVRLVQRGAATGLATAPIGLQLDGGDTAGFVAVDCTAALSAKRQAIAAHRSQLGELLPAGSGFCLSREALRPFLGGDELVSPLIGVPGTSAPVHAAHFDAMFAASADPWRYDSEPYERERHRLTVAALGGRRFADAWDAGCANGALTAMLAPQCDRLLASDASAEAVAVARGRLGPGVSVQRLRLPDEVPEGQFDLILLSDMLYYLGLDGLLRLVEAVVPRMRPGGVLLTVNWLGDTQAAMSGEQAAEALRASLPAWFRLAQQDRHPGFRLERYEVAA